MPKRAAVAVFIALLVQYVAGDFEKITLFKDEFKKCTKGNCKNGGVRMDSWSIALGDGSDEGLDVGLGGLWGNNEEQCYFDTEKVLQVVGDPDDASDGILAIRALNENKAVSCSNSQPGAPSNAKFKSARLHTRGKHSFTYDSTLAKPSVFVEARIQLPDPSPGLWAAFWMLAEPSSKCGEGNACTNVYGAWPASGEIDIMEAVNDMNATLSTIHFASDAAGKTQKAIQGTTPLKDKGDWHVYGVEWNADGLRYYRDAKTVYEIKASQWKSPFYGNGSSSAPFDQKFYIILNLAVGGNLPGPASQFGGAGVMKVDYVHVYRETDKVVTPKSKLPLNGGQIALSCIGALLVILVVAVIVSSLWKNAVTLNRADSFSMLRDSTLTDEHGQLAKRRGIWS